MSLICPVCLVHCPLSVPMRMNKIIFGNTFLRVVEERRGVVRRTNTGLHVGTRVRHAPRRRQEATGATGRPLVLLFLLLLHRGQLLLRLRHAGRRTIPTHPSVNERGEEREEIYFCTAWRTSPRSAADFLRFVALPLRSSERWRLSRKLYTTRRSKHQRTARFSPVEVRVKRDHRWNESRTRTPRLSSRGCLPSARICVGWT